MIGHPECKGSRESVNTVCSQKDRKYHLPETHSDTGQRGTAGFAEEGSAYLKCQDGKSAGECSYIPWSYSITQ